MFSKAVFLNAKKSQGCVLKDERVNRWTEPSLHIYIYIQYHSIFSFCHTVFKNFLPQCLLWTVWKRPNGNIHMDWPCITKQWHLLTHVHEYPHAKKLKTSTLRSSILFNWPVRFMKTKHRGKRRRKVVNHNFLLFPLNFPPFKFL